jgi:uncharacterized protein YndB with AHSA1/START domain
MAVKSAAAGDAGFVNRPSLTFRRRLNASPEKVYAAWTDPQKITRWFGRADATAGSFRAEIDARIGGHFRVSFSANDEYYQVGGVYREVVPNQRLVFSWAWHSTPERESLVTVQLEPDGGGTLLTLRHEQFFDETARDGHQRGWSGALDKLEALFAQDATNPGAGHATAPDRLA